MTVCSPVSVLLKLDLKEVIVENFRSVPCDLIKLFIAEIGIQTNKKEMLCRSVDAAVRV